MAEKILAKSLGVKSQIASGALEFAKGDIDTKHFLIESKATTSDSLGVKINWLAKITKEASNKMKKPALAITFCTANGVPVTNGTWVAIRQRDYEDYVAYLDSDVE